MNPATVSHCPEPSSSHPAIEFLMPSAQGSLLVVSQCAMTRPAG